MKNDAKADITIRTTEYTLRHLGKHADLNGPEAAKHLIANANNPLFSSRKKFNSFFGKKQMGNWIE